MIVYALAQQLPSKHLVECGSIAASVVTSVAQETIHQPHARTVSNVYSRTMHRSSPVVL